MNLTRPDIVSRVGNNIVQTTNTYMNSAEFFVNQYKFYSFKYWVPIFAASFNTLSLNLSHEIGSIKTFNIKLNSTLEYYSNLQAFSEIPLLYSRFGTVISS